jgi:predicted dehydrogenase
MRAGQIGKPYLASASSAGDFWHPSRGMQSEWMYHREQGGGYLMGMGSHDVDYVGALLGEPVAVCADVRTSVPERRRDDGSTLLVDADDTSALLLRMANGTLATIVTSAIALGQSVRAFEIFGSTGSLSMRGPLMGDGEVEILAGAVGQNGTVAIPPSDRMPGSGAELPTRRAAGAIRALALMLEDWLPAFDGEPTPVPTLRDGDRVQRVVDAALRSQAGEGWVALE